eukprot:scaffold74394_cov57-Phaeocystis_antarctica.AAC.5
MVGSRPTAGRAVRGDEAMHSDVVLVLYSVLVVERGQVRCAEARSEGGRLAIVRQRGQARVALGDLRGDKVSPRRVLVSPLHPCKVLLQQCAALTHETSVAALHPPSQPRDAVTPQRRRRRPVPLPPLRLELLGPQRR